MNDAAMRVLVASFRQSLRTCTMHPGGPVVAMEFALNALDHGELSPEDWPLIGAAIVDACEVRLSDVPPCGPDARAERLVALTASLLFAQAPSPGLLARFADPCRAQGWAAR